MNSIIKSTLSYALAIILTLAGLLLSSCIEDGIDTSPSSQPEFSVKTLDMGLTYTDQPTPTHRFTVRNRHDKILNISSIALRDGMDRIFRLNVDGFSGREFSNIEIRPNDSIFVFVAATLPPNASPLVAEVSAWIDFVTNGVQSSVELKLQGQDVDRRRGYVVEADEKWEAGMPYQIFDSLVVAKGATLTLGPGVQLSFHDKARMRVEGRLISEGTPEAPVNMCGDRTYNVVGDIPFDLMASQWNGLLFAPESRDNRLSHTVVRNTVNGVAVDSLASVSFHNCRLRNAATLPLRSYHADITLTGTEVAEGGAGLFAMHGGTVKANHCTFANYYLFAAISGAALIFDHYDAETDDLGGLPLLKADFSNCIVYGLGSAVNKGDLTGTEITLRGCVIKGEGEDDDNFISSVWDTDPLYGTVREDYLFDYRLRPESPVAGKADPLLTLPESATDFYGVSRLPEPSPGAYQAVYEEPEAPQE